MDYFKKIVPGSWAHQKKVEYPKGANCGSPFRDKRLKKAIIAGNAQECSDILESYQPQCQPTKTKFEKEAAQIYYDNLKLRKLLRVPRWYFYVTCFFATTTALSVGYMVVSECLPADQKREGLNELIAVVGIGSYALTFVTGVQVFLSEFDSSDPDVDSREKARKLRKGITSPLVFKTNKQ